MDWQTMVIGQLSLLLLGTAGACFWHIRKLRGTNRSLHEALESLQSGSPAADQPPDPVAQESPLTAAEIEPSEPDDARPAQLDTGASTTDESALAPPDTQTPTAPSVQDAPNTVAAATEMPDAGGNGLKKLLQQFTQDSRDMVTRIEQLERQTQALIDQASEKSSEQATEETGEKTSAEASAQASG